MANLILICGPQAVGKMTVAETLRDKLKYNLMLNHDSIEISDRIFGMNTPAQKEFNAAFREKAFEIAAEQGVNLIFTYVASFEKETEISYLKSLEKMFTAKGGNFYFAELFAAESLRLQRNRTPHRLEKKPSKRDLSWSDNNLIKSGAAHRQNTLPGEILFENHIKIDNSALTPEETAEKIINAFGLTPQEKEEKEYRFGV